MGTVPVGGGAPVSVQSMTCTDTRDVRATVAQIRRLARAGCEIVRVAVPDETAARALQDIAARSPIPLIADIHFHHRLALLSMDAPIHGLRINPGNIGSRQRLAAVAAKAAGLGIPIRIGINAGSLERDLRARHGRPTVDALVESALRNIDRLEAMSFRQLKVSIKSADVRTCVEAYRRLARKTRHPLHIGVTEAGTVFSGTIKSAVGLGILLAEGIGDTMRVSLSADPVTEVRAAFDILRSLGIRQVGPELISCPTCGRRQIDVVSLAAQVEKRIAHIRQPLKIAVMGCEVNGPGEAREADIGIAGSSGAGVLFKHGTVIRRCPQERLLDELMGEIEQLVSEDCGPERQSL